MTPRLVAAFLRLAALSLALAMIIPAPVTGAVMGLDEPLADPQQEARARDIAQSLRCVVCQNQTIDDSEAPLARDMRRLVRERIAAGGTNEEVIGYITERYGDFVLMRPPFQPNTWILWLAPVAVALTGAGGVALLVLRRRRMGGPHGRGSDVHRYASMPLTPDEQAALGALLAREEKRRDSGQELGRNASGGGRHRNSGSGKKS
ncbi:cytochrome c-type biogenesis protein [Fodinicurvata sp. EGI_FJ10296]|uniref:cytochrome c-type biogenesis protein n=1 Tax=Fodinicurvata sp. EGI_FJ10296 TaxID=3231908 RepID=UPI003452E60D